MAFLNEALVFLLAAVVVVPLFKWLGLGSVLGFLAAGLAIGPDGLGLFWDVDMVLGFAELGVVFLLFLVGLELHPARLWSLRKPILGLGGGQVLLTGLAIGAVAWAFGMDWRTAAVIGGALSLSSTAFVLQLLSERHELRSVHGRDSFAVLLFQDLAVIPMLVVVPLLAVGAAAHGGGEAAAGEGAHAGIHSWGQAAVAVVFVAALPLLGRYLVTPALTVAARTKLPELFTAAALLLVMGTAWLMHALGLSMALGAFLAGVLLANSQYRHQLEATIDPFKGLLLGLFFMAVGMSVDLDLVADRPLLIAAIALGLVVLKAMVLFPLALALGRKKETAGAVAANLAQGGEFAFVLFTAAVGAGVMERAVVDVLIAAVTVSMAVTPLLAVGRDRLGSRLAGKPTVPAYDDIDHGDHHPRVLLLGFGRFGQIVGRTLSMAGIPFTALDADHDQIEVVRRFGHRVYYGDPSRADLLRAAGAADAEVIVMSIPDPSVSVHLAGYIRRHYPRAHLLARARDRAHAYALMAAGVEMVVRETFHSGLEMTRDVLTALGMPKEKAARVVETFREHDEELMAEQYAIRDSEEDLAAAAREAAIQLRGLFEQDFADEARTRKVAEAPEGEGDGKKRA